MRTECITSDGRFNVGSPARHRDGFAIRVLDTATGRCWTQFAAATMSEMRGAREEILAAYQPGGRARGGVSQ